ncbi:hypothetical protein O3M35_002284 [Rhynocoris fuscipes]|uniref:Uncharacterized protein n=1 Tax=Rhynocoris fuscipes TaxID=488301 RepID=A0AAW1CMA0_9HEMI
MLKAKYVARGILLTNKRSYSGHSSILKRVWNSWVPIPTGVGLTLLAILQWRRLEKERRKKLGTSDVAGDWELQVKDNFQLTFTEA